MKESTKIRLKALAGAFLLALVSPVTFLIAAVHQQWFTKKTNLPQTFWQGIKIMAATYYDLYSDLRVEIQFGVATVENGYYYRNN